MTLGLCSVELWTGNVALSTIRAGVVDVELIDAILAIVHVSNGLISHTGNAQVFTVLSVKILGRIGDAAGVDSLVHYHGNGDLLGIPLPVTNLTVRWSANRSRF
jgi:hypothetical protein